MYRYQFLLVSIKKLSRKVLGSINKTKKLKPTLHSWQVQPGSFLSCNWSHCRQQLKLLQNKLIVETDGRNYIPLYMEKQNENYLLHGSKVRTICYLEAVDLSQFSSNFITNKFYTKHRISCVSKFITRKKSTILSIYIYFTSKFSCKVILLV